MAARAVGGGELEAGDLVGVVDQAQAAAGLGEQPRGVHRVAAERAQFLDQVGGGLDPAGRARRCA
jgi:hypothetical protein